MSTSDSKAKRLERSEEGLTQHVSEFILNTTLLTKIRRDTEIHDDVGLIGELLRVQTADEQEADAVDESLGQGLQLAAQGWEREQLLRDSLKREIQTCERPYQQQFEDYERQWRLDLRGDARVEVLGHTYLQSGGRPA